MIDFLKQKLDGHWQKIEAVRVILMSGLPGSGKSFWGQQIAQTKGCLCLSSDEIRRQTMKKHSSRFIKTKEEYQRISKIYYQDLLNRVKEVLKKGQQVVVDSSLMMKSNRQMILDSLREVLTNEEMVVLLFKTSNQTAAERLRNKGIDKVTGQPYSQTCLRVRKDFYRLMNEGKASFPSKKEDKIQVIEVINEETI